MNNAPARAIMTRPVVLLLGPARGAVSGVSTHINILFHSGLAEAFFLVHFQVGSEGRVQSGLGRIVRLLTSPLRLAAAILRDRAAIVHVNSSLNTRAYWRDLAYMIVAKACGARVLLQLHGGLLPQEYCRNSRALATLLRATLLLLPDTIVVLATCELDAYRKFLGSGQIVALPNGIDMTPFVGIKPAPIRPDPMTPLRLVYLGRLAKDKGLDELLTGLALACARGVRAELVIAGAGPEEPRLRRLVAAAGLDSTVSFSGPVFGDAKTQLFARSDVFVLASYGEGLPYALLESMAAGVPPIVTAVGAMPDVVTENVHGLFVPLRDPDAIARAIASLAADRALLAQMSSACRRRIAGRYTAERMASDLARLYSDLFDVKQARVLRRS